MSYTSSSRVARRRSIGQVLDATTSATIVAGAAPAQSNAQVSAANAARHADAIRALEIGGILLVFGVGGVVAINAVAKRAAGVDSFWEAKTGKQVLTYAAVSTGLSALGAIAFRASGIGNKILNALPTPGTTS